MNHPVELSSDVGPRPAQAPSEQFKLLFKLLFSVQESAVVLGVSPRTIQNLISTGKLLAKRIGRRVVIHKSALEEFAHRDHPNVEAE
jgi:excisionase family DNA binding protein